VIECHIPEDLNSLAGKHFLLHFLFKMVWHKEMLSVLYNFPIKYTIWRAHVNEEGLKLSRTHKLTVFGDYVNLLGW